jgi:hypothetical protein
MTSRPVDVTKGDAVDAMARKQLGFRVAASSDF